MRLTGFFDIRLLESLFFLIFVSARGEENFSLFTLSFCARMSADFWTRLLPLASLLLPSPRR